MTALRRKFNALDLKDNLSIVHTARKGVRPNIFYSFSEVVNIPEKNLAALLHIHPRTINNYRVRKKYFNPIEGEHLLKLIQLFTIGEEIFGDLEQFNQWLKSPNWYNKEVSMKWLDTPGGVDLVLMELNRLAHGYVA